MGYTKENYSLVRAEYEEKRQKALNAAELRRGELHNVIPETKEIDSRLGMTGIRLMGAALKTSGETVADIRADVDRLKARRDALLSTAGYPTDYSEPRYDCPECEDSGYINGRMCRCMKQRLIMAEYESSGLGRLMRTQTFETFSLDYYADDRRSLENMRYIYNAIRRFAETFDPRTSGSISLFGGTGLGKTHLTTATAKVVIERGYDVVYSGAIGMFSDFERARFGNSSGQETGEKTERYYGCDLLMIDDLGSEMSNQFTVSALYDVINTRINKGLPMMISTNLRQDEMRSRYGDRITSRIFGEFAAFMLTGTDVRAKKLARPHSGS